MKGGGKPALHAAREPQESAWTCLVSPRGGELGVSSPNSCHPPALSAVLQGSTLPSRESRQRPTNSMRVRRGCRQHSPWSLQVRGGRH